MRLQPLLNDTVIKLLGRLEGFRGTSTILRLDHIFNAFTGSIISKVCCETQQDFLDDSEFAPHW